MKPGISMRFSDSSKFTDILARNFWHLNQFFNILNSRQFSAIFVFPKRKKSTKKLAFWKKKLTFLDVTCWGSKWITTAFSIISSTYHNGSKHLISCNKLPLPSRWSLKFWNFWKFPCFQHENLFRTSFVFSLKSFAVSLSQ